MSVHRRITVLILFCHSRVVLNEFLRSWRNFSPLTPPNEVVATENVSQPADVDPSAIDPLFPGSDDNKQREV